VTGFDTGSSMTGVGASDADGGTLLLRLCGGCYGIRDRRLAAFLLVTGRIFVVRRRKFAMQPRLNFGL
jgi:hypothetical protein